LPIGIAKDSWRRLDELWVLYRGKFIICFEIIDVVEVIVVAPYQRNLGR
jgi:hypothetical protein